jgi:hypothetical protein
MGSAAAGVASAAGAAVASAAGAWVAAGEAGAAHPASAAAITRARIMATSFLSDFILYSSRFLFLNPLALYNACHLTACDFPRDRLETYACALF